MKKVLIDSDVILDFFFDRKPFSDDAASILLLCEKKVVHGYTTAISLSNIYYLLRKFGSHEKVIDKLKILLQLLDVVETNKNIVHKALSSKFKDFEDALQNYSAQDKGGISIIITRNIKDYKNSSLSVMSPDIFLKSYKIK